jgi:hypothetical protein
MSRCFKEVVQVLDDCFAQVVQAMPGRFQLVLLRDLQR